LLSEALRSEVSLVCDSLRNSKSGYEIHLGERLSEVLRYSGTDVVGFVRTKITLRDLSYFKSLVAHYTMMHQNWSEGSESFAPEVAELFKTRQESAQRSERILNDLWHLEKTTPMSQ
jgi:hypothetical protein